MRVVLAIWCARLGREKKNQDETKLKHMSLSDNELARFIKFRFRFVSADTCVWAGHNAVVSRRKVIPSSQWCAVNCRLFFKKEPTRNSGVSSVLSELLTDLLLLTLCEVSMSFTQRVQLIHEQN